MSELINEISAKGLTVEQLAEEVGWGPDHLKLVLEGGEVPKDTEKSLRSALLRLEIRTERERHGLSTDLQALVDGYRETDHEYAGRLARAMGLEVGQGDG